MVERVVLHIGLPKTGTTYLQGILWDNRERLQSEEGVVLPGRNHREHLWAAFDVHERSDLARRDPRAPGTWERLCAELDEATEPVGLVTHEFFCGASAEQAQAAVERLRPATVDVVVTARDTAGMLAAGWQEMVKNGSEADPERAADPTRQGEFSWDTWDLGGVLERWSTAVPAEHLHVLPVPGPGEPRDQHWRNFASVLGLQQEYDAPERPANPSLGAAQVELLRRVNAHLGDFHGMVDRGRWIRGVLAERHLSAQGGERFALDDDLVAECRKRSRHAVDLIQDLGVHVVGDVEALLVPEALPSRQPLHGVTDAELLDSATRLVADLLRDLREAATPPPAPPPPPRSLPRRVLGRLRRSESGQ